MESRVLRITLAAASTLALLAASVPSTSVGAPIVVPNFSFESPVLPPNSGSGSPPPWVGPVGGNGGAGHFRSGSALYPNQDGNQMAYLFVRNQAGSFGALFQDVTTIAAGTYSVTVGAAKEAFVPPTTVPLTLNMEAVTGGPTTLLAGNNFPVTTFNTTSLTDVTTSVVVPPGSPQIGRTLRIVIAVNGQDAGGNPGDPRATYNVDNVRLNFVGVPEPGSAAIASIVLVTFAGALRRRFRR